MSRARDLGDVGSKANFLDNVSTDLGDFSGQSIPHIIPDVLYPAVEGKDLAGVAFSGSYVYGTAHTDGRKYYYTSIKGSRPIKDPRIGAHFGSQRHKFKSLQLLEQETATHGSNVYSIDGREWARAVDVTSGAITSEYTSNGTDIMIASNKEGWIEIVGYFNAVNLIMRTYATRKSITPYVNGVAGSTQNPSEASVTSPLISRYVDSGSVVSLTLPSTSLGINTLLIKDNIESNNYTNYHYGIELIAQDTSNRNNIQIPSQNVVSYGKKFTVSGTPHYDPFNGFTSGSSVSSYIDTATSLGVEKWKNSSTYYRPYNGGRVVKWVDSSGVIKTSVTLMPPNAKSIADSSSLTNGTAKANASIANNTFYPTFEAHTTDVNEDQLHEVAKTYFWQEFGNGSANGGTGASYADASMLASNSADDIAYVMDDGLTSLSGTLTYDYATTTEDIFPSATDKYLYVTFIGTGISYYDESDEVWETAVQNLPYGTHIMSFKRDGTLENSPLVIDGVQIKTEWLRFKEFAFHQPKKPPIPENACVIADYMLVADYVKLTSRSSGTEISKGVRFLSGSRDVFYDGTSFTNNTILDVASLPAGYSGCVSNAAVTAKLPFFGTDVNMSMENQGAAHTLTFPGTTANAKTGIDGPADKSDVYTLADSATLGVNEVIGTILNGGYHFNSFYVATPIHTSSHYQSFETPFLHELVGGDRNMEQTNLVVSPDGKTWDELTRDTSYIGANLLSLNFSNGHGASENYIRIPDDCRGVEDGKTLYNKNFAIAYDRVICLVDGQYQIDHALHYGQVHPLLMVNGTTVHQIHSINSTIYGAGSVTFAMQLKRGDYVQTKGGYSAGTGGQRYSNFQITKL